MRKSLAVVLDDAVGLLMAADLGLVTRQAPVFTGNWPGLSSPW